VCDSVVFAHLQCGIDPPETSGQCGIDPSRTWERMDCDVIDVNSAPDESARVLILPCAWKSLISVASLVFPFSCSLAVFAHM